MLRAFAELLEDEQELEAERLGDAQAKAADMAELHKKEVDLKRVRTISAKYALPNSVCVSVSV